MASRSVRRSSYAVMRERMSSSCFWLSARVSALAKWNSGMRSMSRCGLTKAPACGIATCEWMSTVVLCGLISRPGLPCRRAAVLSYLFQCVVMTSFRSLLLIYTTLLSARPRGSGDPDGLSMTASAGERSLDSRFRGNERREGGLETDIKTRRDAAR